ncbi:GntR family transcriptional regulator [Streptomyces canus]|uniref:GntR family transcriptional regulator n=1 Tax=Streptomyces canus TaxID=58343 RepID=UPI003408D587
MAEKRFPEIAAHFRQLIDDGTLRPGDPMPSMAATAEQFGVTVTTVNKAYRMLKAEGLTLAKAGVGTVVAVRPKIASTGAARLRRIARGGKPYAAGEVSVNHTATLRSCADSDIATQLGVDLHDEVVLRTRVFLREGEPSVVALSAIHPRALGPVPELLSGEPFERFWQEIYTERTGREVIRLPERRGARLAARSELDALGVVAPPSAAVPVLVLMNVFHDDEGPLEVWEDVYKPGVWMVEDE